MEQDIKDAATLLRKIRVSLEKMELDESLKEIENHKEVLQYELCCIAKMFVPAIHQKIDEIIEVGKRKEIAPNSKVVVSEHQHGADLVEGNTHTELKVSIIKAKTKNKCNFSFNIPAGKDVTERRQRFLEGVYEKTKNDGAIFTIKDQRAKIVESFHFSSGFLLEYFKQIEITEKTTKYNFGCIQCTKCNKFHRLEKLKQCEVQFNLNPESFKTNDWTVLTKSKVASTCE
jgi:hypothetical protein